MPVKAVVDRASHHDPGSRFPAFWGPNFDWVPDQDHGGVLLKAVQAMLLQIRRRQDLPASRLARDWDVEFKLRAPRNTTVECSYQNGRIVKLSGAPERASQGCCADSARRNAATGRNFKMSKSVVSPFSGMPAGAETRPIYGGASAQIDLASDSAWTLSADGGPARPIRVPGGGWNSEQQKPPIDTMNGVQDYALYERTLVVPKIAPGQVTRISFRRRQLRRRNPGQRQAVRFPCRIAGSI